MSGLWERRPVVILMSATLIRLIKRIMVWWCSQCNVGIVGICIVDGQEAAQ